jgi:hypothetical protein
MAEWQSFLGLGEESITRDKYTSWSREKCRWVDQVRLAELQKLGAAGENDDAWMMGINLRWKLFWINWPWCWVDWIDRETLEGSF